MRTNDIIISTTRPSRGAISLIKSDYNQNIASTGFAVIRDIIDVERKYLFYLLRSKYCLDQMENKSSGGNYPAITLENLKSLQIPLPPLPVQKKLAVMMDEAYALKKQKETEAKELLDSIDSYVMDKLGIKIEQKEEKKIFAVKISSLFNSRLDPEFQIQAKKTLNKFDYKFVELQELCDIGSGGTPSRSKEEYFNGDIPWVTTGEVRENIILETEKKITELGLKKSSAKLYPKGSLVLAMYGATVGRTAKLGIDATTNQACAVMSNFNKKIYPDYLWVYITAKKQDLISIASGSAQPNLNAEKVKKFTIPLPPLDIQQSIAAEVMSRRAKAKQLQTEANEILEKAKEKFQQTILV